MMLWSDGGFSQRVKTIPIQNFFSEVDSNDTFNEGISQEIGGLTDEERASLENFESGDKDMSDENTSSFYFPSTDSNIREHDRQMKALKFAEEQARHNAIAAAESQKKRDYFLEKELIRKQGPLNRILLSKDYLKQQET